MIWKTIKELALPDLEELGFSGVLSISFAGLMDFASTETLHLIAVVISSVAGASALHLTRYFWDKYLPRKKDKL